MKRNLAKIIYGAAMRWFQTNRTELNVCICVIAEEME